MKGPRALATGMLVLASICAVPAVSAAQDAGTTTAATTTTAPDPVVPPADPGGSSSTAPTASGGPGAGTPGEAPDQSRTADTPLADSPPATGPPGGGGAKAHKAASASVTMGDFFFSPASVTVAVGDTVTWHNTGQAPHTATANDGSFDTGTINAGGSGSHTFASAGTFSYICTIHPNMKGTVRVLSSSGGSGGNAGSSSSGTSESSAVASPGAAGSSTTLPMTGMAVGALALVGLALLASGVLVRRAGGHGRGWLSIF